MADLFDYLFWRDDLTFEQDELNEVDAVILSRFSYLPFEHLQHWPVSVRDAAVALLMEPEIESGVLMEADLQLLSRLAHGRRFAALQLYDYVNQIDTETQTQFSALTVKLDEKRWFVLFRGTDSTLVGWKENFNMAFTCPVPAQTAATAYLERIAADRPGEFLLGGHSKGGNLAVYASACCSPEVQQRIIHVYNLDGPGFTEAVIETPGYQRICGRVSTYVPQSSVVGMLLEHEESYTIVHSSETVNLMQHDVYSWEVEQKRFACVETVTDGSRFIDATVKGWLAALEPEQREKFIDAVYDLLVQTNAKTMRQLRENWLSSGVTILRALRDMDDQTRTVITQVLQALHQAMKGELYEVLKARPARLRLEQKQDEEKE